MDSASRSSNCLPGIEERIMFPWPLETRGSDDMASLRNSQVCSNRECCHREQYGWIQNLSKKGQADTLDANRVHIVDFGKNPSPPKAVGNGPARKRSVKAPSGDFIPNWHELRESFMAVARCGVDPRFYEDCSEASEASCSDDGEGEEAMVTEDHNGLYEEDPTDGETHPRSRSSTVDPSYIPDNILFGELGDESMEDPWWSAMLLKTEQEIASYETNPKIAHSGGGRDSEVDGWWFSSKIELWMEGKTSSPGTVGEVAAESRYTGPRNLFSITEVDEDDTQWEEVEEHRWEKSYQERYGKEGQWRNGNIWQYLEGKEYMWDEERELWRNAKGQVWREPGSPDWRGEGAGEQNNRLIYSWPNEITPL